MRYRLPCHALKITHLLVFPLPITHIWVLSALSTIPVVPCINTIWIISEFLPYPKIHFFEAVPLDKLYFPKGTMFYHWELYS